MISFFREFKKEFGIRFKQMFTSILLFRVITILILAPLMRTVIKVFVGIFGFKYITTYNILSIFQSPLAVLSVIIIFIGFAYILILEYCMILMIYYGRQDGYKQSYRNIFVEANKKLRKCLMPKNITILFLAFFLTSVTFLKSTVFQGLRVPVFIEEAIFSNDLYTISFILLNLIVFIASIYLIYTLNAFFVLDLTLWQSILKSIEIVKKRFFYILFRLLSVNFFIYLALTGLSQLSIILTRIATDIDTQRTISVSIIYGILKVFLMVVSILKVVLIVGYTRIFVSYTFNKFENCGDTWYNTRYIEKTKVLYRKLRIIILLLALIIFNIGYSLFEIYIIKDTSNVRTTITAHRGGGFSTPENTLISLKRAAYDGVDYAEIDVQLTKDKKVILLHDKSFKRVAGIDKRPIDMTLEEIKKLDAGSYFEKKFTGEKIPTLEEAIAVAKEFGLKLNIEVKANKKLVKDTVSKVVEIMKKEKVTNTFLLTSLNYTSLEIAKKIAPELRTGYIAAFGLGDISNLSYADLLCIEISNVNAGLIDIAHSVNKEIYVWTANTQEEIDKLIDLQVDGIITDEPLMVGYAQLDYYHTNPLMRQLKRNLYN